MSDSAVVGTFPGRVITRGTAGLLGRTVIVTVIICILGLSALSGDVPLYVWM